MSGIAVFSEYKDIFGKPREGAHAPRIFGLAAVDLILTILVALILPGNKIRNILVLIALGCIMHALFGVDSELNKRISSIGV